MWYIVCFPPPTPIRSIRGFSQTSTHDFRLNDAKIISFKTNIISRRAHPYFLTVFLSIFRVVITIHAGMCREWVKVGVELLGGFPRWWSLLTNCYFLFGWISFTAVHMALSKLTHIFHAMKRRIHELTHSVCMHKSMCERCQVSLASHLLLLRLLLIHTIRLLLVTPRLIIKNANGNVHLPAAMTTTMQRIYLWFQWNSKSARLFIHPFFPLYSHL